MKRKLAIVAAAFLFIVGCETTGNTTGSGPTSANNNNASVPAPSGGISTSGTSNPATTATSARSTLTDGATASGEGNTNATTSASTMAPAASAIGTNPNSTATMNGQSGTPANNANSSTMNSTTASGTAQAGSLNSSMNQTSAGANPPTAGSFSVPSPYQSAFSTRYPTASNVQWSRYNSTDVPIDWELTDWAKLDNNDYVVRYNVGSEPHYAWYDSEGNWVGTSATMKNASGLPPAINTMLATKYKGYTISSANTEHWKDRTAYQVEMKNATTKVKLLVDANGNVIKKKTEVQ